MTTRRCAPAALAGTVCVLLLACTAPASEPATGPDATATASSSPSATASASPTLPDASPRGIVHGSARTYRVTYTVVVRSTGFRTTKASVWIAGPGASPGQQTARRTTIAPRPTRTGTDAASQTAMSYWTFSRLPRTGKVLSVTASWVVSVSDTRTFLQPSDVTAYDTTSRNYRLYTRAERYIESDDPVVRRTAASVVGTETNPLVRARLLYDYVVRRLSYVTREGGLDGARTALTRGTGDCSEYAALFVALARASGIPARPVVGWIAESGPDQGHTWAEFWLDGWGWVPVDPTWGDEPAERDYWFGGADTGRISIGRGFSTRPAPAFPDGSVWPEAVGAAWWYWGSGDDDRLKVTDTLVVEPVA